MGCESQKRQFLIIIIVFLIYLRSGKLARFIKAIKHVTTRRFNDFIVYRSRDHAFAKNLRFSIFNGQQMWSHWWSSTAKVYMLYAHIQADFITRLFSRYLIYSRLFIFDFERLVNLFLFARDYVYIEWYITFFAFDKTRWFGVSNQVKFYIGMSDKRIIFQRVEASLN